jgi:uracil-DNA glycosylase
LQVIFNGRKGKQARYNLKDRRNSFDLDFDLFSSDGDKSNGIPVRITCPILIYKYLKIFENDNPSGLIAPIFEWAVFYIYHTSYYNYNYINAMYKQYNKT